MAGADFTTASQDQNGYNTIINTYSKKAEVYSIYDDVLRKHNNPSVNQIFKSLSDIYKVENYAADVRSRLNVSSSYFNKDIPSADMQWGSAFEVSIYPNDQFIRDFYLSVDVATVNVSNFAIPDLASHFQLDDLAWVRIIKKKLLHS